jgi:hypothetical protein
VFSELLVLKKHLRASTSDKSNTISLPSYCARETDLQLRLQLVKYELLRTLAVSFTDEAIAEHKTRGSVARER